MVVQSRAVVRDGLFLGTVAALQHIYITQCFLVTSSKMLSHCSLQFRHRHHAGVSAGLHWL